MLHQGPPITEMKPLIVLTQWVHPDVIDLLSAHARVIPNDTRKALGRKEILRRAKRADALMVFMSDRVDEEFLDGCPRLKIVAAALKGFDNFDVEACTRRGIYFTIVPDLLTVPTAELAVGLMIALARQIEQGSSFVRSGRFRGWRPQFYGTGLAGMTAGIIGLGRVGKALAQRLSPFEMKIVYYDKQPPARELERSLGIVRVSLQQLLAESDYVIPLVPLTSETYHLINHTRLRLMKAGAFLINTCRGSVINERDVARALREGHLAGYAADVFEMEDWAVEGRPRKIPEELLKERERTLFTPHLGSAIDKVRHDIALEAARNIIQALNGDAPQGAINDPHRQLL